MLVSDACTRAGQATCTRYQGMLKSDLEDWRSLPSSSWSRSRASPADRVARIA
jgi:hypothetical protein